MRLVQALYYARAWLENLFSLRALKVGLASYGGLWLVVQVAAFFLNDPVWQSRLRGMWLLYLGLGILISLAECRPRLAVSSRLNGRDVTIEIAIGDLFSFSGDVIVGSNTTFDTRVSKQLISSDSVQGLFTQRFYADERQLEIEISAGLDGVGYVELPGPRVGKTKKYPVGTCVRLNPKERAAYFVAIADINDHGTASGTFDGLLGALAALWVFVGTRGTKQSLLVPVLGTGFSRLTQMREVVVREIVKSFIAACSETTFAEKLTIVISPGDVAKYDISLEELGAFLDHECRYASFPARGLQAVGTPV